MADPFFVAELHFSRSDGALSSAIHARFAGQMWHRLSSWQEGYHRVGIKCATLDEAIAIVREFEDGFRVFAEIHVEGWERAEAGPDADNVLPLKRA